MTLAPLPASLSDRLRVETRAAHTRAERAGVMRHVLRGTIDRPTYAALLVALAEIYDALEAELARHADDPVLATFALAPLRRGPALHDDLANGTLPNVGFVVPDLCNDAHDCPLGTADAWVAGWMSQALAGPDWRAGRLAVVVTFDEAENGGENTVLTVVVAPGLHGVVADTALTHQSWTRWMSDLVGATAPGAAGSAPSLGAAFGL